MVRWWDSQYRKHRLAGLDRYQSDLVVLPALCRGKLFRTDSSLPDS